MDRMDHGDTKIAGAFLAVSVAAVLQLLAIENLDVHLMRAVSMFSASIPLLVAVFITFSNSYSLKRAHSTVWGTRTLNGMFLISICAVTSGFLAIASHFGPAEAVVFSTAVGVAFVGRVVMNRGPGTDSED